jgi:hypothetical protein
MKISNPKNIPSITESGKLLGVAEPQPLMVVELDSAPLHDPTDPTASTRPLTAPQVPSLQDETNLAKQVLILHG